MEWIHSVLKKIGARNTSWMSCGFQCPVSNQTKSDTHTEAIELAKQKVHTIGKKNHSFISTWIAMLSCIYGMSITKATAIVEWKPGSQFLSWITSVSKQEAIAALSSIQVKSGEKTRKIGKALAARITSIF